MSDRVLKTAKFEEDVYARLALLKTLRYPRARNISELLTHMLDDMGCPPSPLVSRDDAQAYV